MRTRKPSIVWACLVCMCGFGCSSGADIDSKVAETKLGASSEVVFKSTDGRNVYGDLYSSKSGSSKKVVMMFHQAGSNAGEYATIAPQVASLGFDCIAIDQRSGGDMWGRSNRTVNKSGSEDYIGAFSDVVGTLAYAKAKGYTMIVAWGSSYSASLVLKMAEEDTGIDAVLCFSPGEYMDDKSAVHGWASKVTQPVFFACTPDEWKDGRADLFAALKTKDKVSAVLDGGVHGSSTLIPDKSKAAAEYMDRTLTFLKSIKQK